jgi:hypothetical protein
MNHFITYREPDQDGELQYFILQKAHPHYVGMVIDNPNFQSIYKVSIPNTTMFVSFFGTIEGRRFPIHSHAEGEINATLVIMAQWYLDNRILKNQQKFRKWLLSSPAPPPSY